jgi:hypothetical protein
LVKEGILCEEETKMKKIIEVGWAMSGEGEGNYFGRIVLSVQID